jgi:hypothetical protein
MVRFLWTTLIYLLSAAVGLLVANWILDDMEVTAAAFVWAVVIFTVVQAIITPFLFKVVRRNASALIGAVGLISTFVALLVAHLLTDGLTITGTVTWVLATLLLPLFIAKEALGGKVGGRAGLD